MKRIFLLSVVFSIVVANSAFTQDTVKFVENKQLKILKSSYIKFSPLHLLELEPTFQLGFEYPVNNFRIQHEVGYTGLFNPTLGIFDWDNNYSSIQSSGFKIRTTFKFPLKTEHENRALKYIGIDIMYKHLSWTFTDVYVFRSGAYWQWMDLTSRKNVASIHFLMGWNGYVSEINNFITDSYLGIGVRYKMIKNDYDDDIESPDLVWYDYLDGMMISVMAGFKFGFGI